MDDSRQDARVSLQAAHPSRLGTPVVLALGAVLAVAIVASYLTRGFIFGNGEFWVFPRPPSDHSINDMAQCLSGYLFFTAAPWNFPLLVAANFGVPEGTNVALMDSVPLMALTSKILFQGLGVEVNLLGAWVMAGFVLTALAFGFALTRAGVTSAATILAGIALVAIWPALLARFDHIPLLAWFSFLLSFAAYLHGRRDAAALRVAVWCQLALVCLTLFMNVYLTFMTAFFAVVTLLQAVFDREMALRRALAHLALLMAGAIGTMLFIGHIGTSGLPAGGGGYGIWSLNLLSPITPQNSGLFPKAVGVDATGGQYEGYNYLGAGVLLLLGAALLHMIFSAPGRAAAAAGLRRHWVLVLACVALTLFAASNRMFLGDWKLLEVTLPWRVTVFLSAFRSSGRYFWPVSLVLLLAVLVYWSRFSRLRHGTLAALLAVALGLQWIDTRPLRDMITETINEPPRTALERATWGRLIAQHNYVRVYPTVDCVRSMMSYTQFLNSELQLFAAQQRREINIMNTSRPLKDCAREAREMDAATIDDGGLYVFLNWALRPDYTARWKDQPGCRSFEFGVACTRNWGQLNSAPLVSTDAGFYQKLDPVPWQRRRDATRASSERP